MGCFHFGYTRTAPFEFKGAEYIARLEESLRSITNIESLEMENSGELKARDEKVAVETQPIGEGLNWCPGWDSMLVRLRLRVPFRVQAELIGVDESSLETFTERFDVEIRQVYHSPVAIVEPIDPAEECEPSSAVQIVRELLRSAFDRMPTAEIRFSCLGPSPFHANFRIEFADPDEDFETGGFRSEEAEGPGYSEITFYADPDSFATLRDAKYALLSRIGPELDLFYLSCQIRASEMREWEKVEATIAELLGTEQAPGVRGRVIRGFSFGRLLAKTYSAILDYEAFSIENIDEWQRRFSEQYALGGEYYLRERVALQEKELYKRPVQQRMQLLTFMEKRRQNVLQNFVVLASAILGGLVGSLITLALKK